MEPRERRFLGFRYVKQTPPCLSGESPCPFTETLLRQDLPSAGKIEQIDRWAGTAHLGQQKFEYTTNAPTVPMTSLLTGEWNYSYDDSTGASKKTHATHQYDAYGNPSQTVLYGDDDDPADNTTLVWTVNGNPSPYIVDRVALQQQFAGAGAGGTKLSERQFYYDGAASWTVPPSQGYVTASRGWLDTEARYVQRSFGYDNYGNQTSVTDEEARPPVLTVYDPTYHIFPNSVTNGANETETTVWDPVCGLPSQQTDANAKVSTVQSDNMCRSTRTDHLSTGGFVIRSYVSLGDPNTQHIRLETPSSVGGVNLYTDEYFDGFGRTYRTARKGPGSQDILQDTAYDLRGRVSSRTAPYYARSPSYSTTYTYDGLDRPTATRFPGNNGTTQSYPVWSQTFTDEHGHLSTTRFDGFGRMILTEQNAVSPSILTHYGYDLLGRMTGMTDHLGNSWSWTFDSLGRNIEKMDPDAGTWTFEYDDSGLLRRQVDAKSQPTDFTYDNAGRLATKVTAGSTVTITRSEPRGTYSNIGRVTSVVTSSPATSVAIDYDDLGRAAKQFRVLEGVTYVAQKQYDAGGFLQTITYPDNETFGPMQYDGAGRLKAVPGIVTNVEYDAAGRAILQTNPYTTTSRTYSPERGFLTDVVTSSGAIQNLHYTYDAAGLVTQVTSPFAKESWTYVYDPLHRLTSATCQSCSTQSQTFQYDELGRITYNSLIGTYSYPPPGSARPHAPSSVAGNSYVYDANGNLTSGGGRTIQWNADNLPIQVNSTPFLYDGLGERVKKGSGSGATVYPMGDDYQVSYRTMKYFSLEGLGLVAKRIDGINTVWLHTDRLGSIQAITDSGGGLWKRRTYRPYGNKIDETNPLHIEHRGWIGERQDDETGLTYLHARYYDPELGLFISPDPSHPAEATVGVNRYGYSNGDPINAADPTGLRWICWDQIEHSQVCYEGGCTDPEPYVRHVCMQVPDPPSHPTSGGPGGGHGGGGGGTGGGGGDGGSDGGGGDGADNGGDGDDGGKKPKKDDGCGVTPLPTGIVAVGGLQGETGLGDVGVMAQA